MAGSDVTDAAGAGGKLFWLDMEMTGLDPAECVILEVAAIVTDLDLDEIDTFEAVVATSRADLEAMDDWNTSTHTASGLVQRIETEGRPLADVEADLIRFARSHFDDEPIVLCGNSIHQDRRFIERYMPEFAGILHYRMVDVSSFKEILRRRWGVEFEKRQRHRALDDTRESIAELASYLDHFDY